MRRRHQLTLPRHAAAIATMVLGAVMLGSLLLLQLASYFGQWFEIYYGAPGSFSDVTSGAFRPQLVAIAVTSLVGTVAFVADQRLRHRNLPAASDEPVLERPLSRDARVEMLLGRTMIAASALLLMWLIITSLERYQAGLGWEALPYNDWTSLLPLASVCSLSFVVGAFVAIVSMVGLRAIMSLPRAMSVRFRRWLRNRQLVGRPGSTHWTPVSRLFGIHIFSRPPPLGA